MAWGSAFRRPINYGVYSATRDNAYNRLSKARQSKLDAEVQKAWRDHEEEMMTASDEENLAAIGVQLTAAYFTNGQSLAYASQINDLTFSAMGKPKAARNSSAGALSSMAQLGHGAYSAAKADKLAEMDDDHERTMAGMERDYRQAITEKDFARADEISQHMVTMEQNYRDQRAVAKKSWGEKTFGGLPGYGMWGSTSKSGGDYKVDYDRMVTEEDREMEAIGAGVMNTKFDPSADPAKVQQSYNQAREVTPLPANQNMERPVDKQLPESVAISSITGPERNVNIEANRLGEEAFQKQQRENLAKIQEQNDGVTIIGDPDRDARRVKKQQLLKRLGVGT